MTCLTSAHICARSPPGGPCSSASDCLTDAASCTNNVCTLLKDGDKCNRASSCTSGNCSARPGDLAITGDLLGPYCFANCVCSGSSMAPPATVSMRTRRRNIPLTHHSTCPTGEMYCPKLGCVNLMEELQACGNCSTDCTASAGLGKGANVGCLAGKCVTRKCLHSVVIKSKKADVSQWAQQCRRSSSSWF